MFRFSSPIFHFSTIPIFHGLCDCEHHRFGVKSKPDPLGQASLLFFNQVPWKDPGSELFADAVKIKLKLNVLNLVHRSGVVIQI